MALRTGSREAWRTLGSTADAEHHVGRGARLGHLDGSRHVAVRDEADAAAHLAALADDVRVARPVQYHQRHVSDGLACIQELPAKLLTKCSALALKSPAKLTSESVTLASSVLSC